MDKIDQLAQDASSVTFDLPVWRYVLIERMQQISAASMAEIEDY